MTKEYTYHELANYYPMASKDDFSSILDSIKQNGFDSRFPIILYEGKILDGRNRYKATKQLGVEPIYKEYEGNSPIAFCSLTNKRKHYTAGQKACFSVIIEPMLKSEAEKNRTYIHMNICSNTIGGDSPPIVKRTLKKAAEIQGADYKAAKFMKKVKSENPDIFDKVLKGSYSLNDAKRNINVRDHTAKVQAAQSNPTLLIQNKGPYDLILADPCWRYDFSKTVNREIENHYETATQAEIISHKPNSSDNSILFLWATAPKLLEALEVMKAWGFEYKTQAIWNKETIGMGYWFRGMHEILLVGVKGTPGCTPECERVGSIFTEKKTVHSKKPICVYEWIEKSFPDKNKLEMYCRTVRKGWSIWGNEVGAV